MIALGWNKHLSKLFIAFTLCIMLLVTSCAKKPPSPYAEVQKETTKWRAPKSVAKEAQQGSKFNPFFPSKVSGYNVVPAQEKKGFAEYKVNQDGKTVAMLSINDVASIPAAAAKYQDSAATIAGYPSVEQGTKITGILVNDRYQVKVQSRDPGFTPEDRAEWLKKFDLQGLSNLKAARSPKLSAPSAKAPEIPPASSSPTLTPQPAT